MIDMDALSSFAHVATAADPSYDDRTRQIVESAYVLLEDQGLEGLTIRAVLSRTGLARRAFYERFAGKDDLVLAVFEHAIRIAAIQLAGEVASLGDPMERLKLIVSSIARGRPTPDSLEDERRNRRSAAMSRDHLRLADARPIDLQAALSPLLDLIADVLSDGMAAGGVRSAPPQRLAMLVYNLVSTTAHSEFLAQEGMQADPGRRDSLADDIWDFCCRAIAI